MLKHFFRFTLTCIVLISISGFSARGVTLQESVVTPEGTLYKTGLNYLENGQYMKARLAFQSLVDRYPDNDLTAASYFAIGATFYEEGKQDTITTIERIDIQGNRYIPEERIRFYIQSYPGDIYSEERLEYDLRALWKSYFFDDIQIREKDGETGKIITFVFREKPLVYSIEFAGNLAFFESDIYDAFKENKVGLIVDGRYDPEKIKAAERVMKNLMIKNGIPAGSIRTEIERISPIYVHVRFILDEEAEISP